MADTDLRRLERLALQGDATAEAQHLLGRVRAGELPLERLQLAAYLGDPAALAALGEDAGESSGPAVEDVGRWVEGLRRWGRDVLARAALGAAEAVLPVWEGWEPGQFAPGSSLRQALEAAEAWVAAPREQALAEAARTSLEEADAVLDRTAHLLNSIDLEHRAVGPSAWRALDAGWAVVGALRAAGWHLAGQRGILIRTLPNRRGAVPWKADECQRALGSAEALRSAIRRALVPLALGSGRQAPGAGD